MDPFSEPLEDETGRIAARGCALGCGALLASSLLIVCLVYGAWSLLVALWP
jgi:hypothetical protein